MNTTDPEFALAELDLEPSRLKRIARIRKATLPKPKKLEKIREQIEGRLNKLTDPIAVEGLLNLDVQELAFGTSSSAQLYPVEHGPTAQQVGAAGLHPYRPNEYRLLWLHDGRTFEVVQTQKNAAYTIYADGIDVGSVQAVDQRMMLWVFPITSGWRISIGGEEVCTVRAAKRKRMRVSVEFVDGRSLITWIGPAKSASGQQMLKLLHSAGLREERPGNSNWFLPRDEHDKPIADTLEDRLALLGMSLLMRTACMPSGE
tara:strand:- start:15617 stop:16393 length:777 start_codon:yes stop_codon:yes gene_type:complete